jgi:hypothetical protein
MWRGHQRETERPLAENINNSLQYRRLPDPTQMRVGRNGFPGEQKRSPADGAWRSQHTGGGPINSQCFTPSGSDAAADAGGLWSPLRIPTQPDALSSGRPEPLPEASPVWFQALITGQEDVPCRASGYKAAALDTAGRELSALGQHHLPSATSCELSRPAATRCASRR